MKTILTPVDFSATSDRVIAEAVALARAYGGRVVLLHVTEPTAKVVDYAALVMAYAQIDEAAVRFSVERLHQLEQRLRADQVDATSVHVAGMPVTEIVAQAGSFAADYIVMGSHGHTAFYDLLVGGTAHGVLKRAPCPVVIVPPARKPKHASVA